MSIAGNILGLGPGGGYDLREAVERVLGRRFAVKVFYRPGVR